MRLLLLACVLLAVALPALQPNAEVAARPRAHNGRGGSDGKDPHGGDDDGSRGGNHGGENHHSQGNGQGHDSHGGGGSHHGWDGSSGKNSSYDHQRYGNWTDWMNWTNWTNWTNYMNHSRAQNSSYTFNITDTTGISNSSTADASITSTGLIDPGTDETEQPTEDTSPDVPAGSTASGGLGSADAAIDRTDINVTGQSTEIGGEPSGTSTPAEAGLANPISNATVVGWPDAPASGVTGGDVNSKLDNGDSTSLLTESSNADVAEPTNIWDQSDAGQHAANSGTTAEVDFTDFGNGETDAWGGV